ncbi:hypothetical protein PCE31106_00127 [Pandoraea cepalis]|uniref:DUF559 domain-containing protein n=2 Tax=Burkholderiales TaxID=80840 RepID=A0A5E4RHY2_9BURK|nr:integrase repeat-containing protein [Burkholderia vietnamiensis]VVD61629.1 hypothetical protein PCE31106_00127 [Pandoraea cepalis]
MAKRTFRPYGDASAWAQEEGIRTMAQWRLRSLRKELPADLPAAPYQIYKGEWKGWGTFLGTGRRYRGAWCSYHEAAAWGQAEGIKTGAAWMARKDFPANIPADPFKVYGDEFKSNGGWPGFLNTSMIRGRSMIELALAHGLGSVLILDQTRRATIDPGDGGRKIQVDLIDRSRRLAIEYDGSYWHQETQTKDRRQVRRLNKAGWTVVRVREAPLGLLDPTLDLQVDRPEGNYGRVVHAVLRHLACLIRDGRLLNDGLLDKIEQALGKPMDPSAFCAIATHSWRSYEEAATWAQAEGIKTFDDWIARCRRGDLPADIPVKPARTYKGDWKDWGTFLGTGRLYRGTWCSYDEAAAWARAEGIQTAEAWKDRSVKGCLPKYVPANPQKIYKSEWNGWGAFLGTGRKPNRHPNAPPFRSYSDASAWAQREGIASQRLWYERCKDASFPINIPKKPEPVYRDEWTNWGNFLGTGRKPGGQPRLKRPTNLYVIRLTKPTDRTPVLLPANDPAFVMPMAA